MHDHDDDLEDFAEDERAELARLSSIEAKHEPTPPLGAVEEIGLLRRREFSGAAYYQGLGPAAYVVRLDDGHIAWGTPDVARLDDTELARFAAHTARLAGHFADEQLRRAVRP